MASAGQPIEGRLADPTLELHDATGALIAANDDWESDSQAEQLTALQIAPTDPKEAALFRALSPGAYTVIVQGAAGTTGIGLAEVYDVGMNQTQRLANISTRGRVETGDNVMIGGVIIAGPDDATMLIRAIAPSLEAVGLTGVLPDPQLDLYDAQGTKIDSNNNWRESSEPEILATGIAPFNDRESAILSTLGPGGYTAIVSGAGETTGVALVEAYNLP